MKWGSRRTADDPWEAPFRAAVKANGGKVHSYALEGSEVSFKGDRQTISLHNFVQGNQDLPPSRREEALKTWLAWALPAPEGALSDRGFAAVQEALMPRLGPPFDPNAMRGLFPASQESVAQGVLTFIVVDSPNRVSYVLPEDFQKWQKTFEEALPIAMDNLRRRSDPKKWSTFPRLPELMKYSTGDAFDAARALILQDLIEPWPRFGVMVGIPRRDTLLVLLLNDPLAFASAPHLIVVINGLVEEGPYPVSNRLLWFDGHEWEEIHYSMAGKDINLIPSDRFAKTVLLADAQPK